MTMSRMARKVYESPYIKESGVKVNQQQINAVVNAMKEVILDDLYEHGKFYWRGLFTISLSKVMGYTKQTDEGLKFTDDYVRMSAKPSGDAKLVIDNSKGLKDIGF